MPAAAEPDPSPAALDLVTVVYGAEIVLLQLQARSIARFLDPAGIGEILVVVNDRDQAGCVERVRAILPDYGALADRVRILRPEDLFVLRPARLGPRGIWDRARAAFTAYRRFYPLGVKGGWRGNRGWAVQQALKLLAARCGSGANVLILDAKNHFVRPVSVASFVAPDGRSLARLAPPNPKHLRWNRFSFRRMGLPEPGPDDISLPTITPIVAPRAGLVAAVDAIEARIGPAETFFARKRTEESEFALINAFLASRPGGLLASFAPGLIPAATLWPGKDDAEIEGLLASVERGEVDVLSVHKRRLGKLSPQHLARLRAIWDAAGLDASELLDADAAQRQEHGRKA